MSVALRRVMIALAVLGVGLTIYLTYVHYAGIKPVCTAGQACIKVQSSQWSKLAGVPVAVIGLAGYIVILGTLLVRDREETRLAVLGMTLIGVGFSGYLTYRELFSIHAVCEECATSAVFMTLLLICAIARYLLAPLGGEPAVTPAEDGVAPPPARGRQAALRG